MSNMSITAGSKIDFKVPGSGKGRPSVATVVSVSDTSVTATDRLGKEIEVQTAWIRGSHTGSYTRKTNADIAADIVAAAVANIESTEDDTVAESAGETAEA